MPERLVLEQKCDAIDPLLLRTRVKTVDSVADDSRIDTNGRNYGRDPEGHVLESLKAALSAGPFVVGQRHQPNVERAQIFDLGIELPGLAASRDPVEPHIATDNQEFEFTSLPQ